MSLNVDSSVEEFYEIDKRSFLYALLFFPLNYHQMSSAFDALLVYSNFKVLKPKLC